MKIIHDDGYNNNERLRYKPVVYCNVVQSLVTIIKAMNMLEMKYESEVVSAEASQLISFVRSKYSIDLICIYQRYFCIHSISNSVFTKCLTLMAFFPIYFDNFF